VLISNTIHLIQYLLAHLLWLFVQIFVGFSFFFGFLFFFFFIFAVDAQQKACVLSPESLSWGRALSSSSLSWVLAGGFSPFSPTGKLLVCQIIACQKMSPGVGSCQVV